MKEFNRAYVQAVRSLLKEADKPEEAQQEKRPVVSYANAGVGGNWKAEYKSSRTRAVEEPQKLMKLLGVSQADGKSDAEKAVSVINQAINGNETMAEAYDTPKVFAKKYNDKMGYIVEVPLASDNLPYRDAVFFLSLTILGAHNAGLLSVKNTIRFIPDGKAVGSPIFFVES